MRDVNLTNRETATVLAALRNWQEITSEEGGNDPRELSPNHFEDVEPLSSKEISALCQKINFEDDDQGDVLLCPSGGEIPKDLQPE
jgi:hypothetical protein